MLQRAGLGFYIETYCYPCKPEPDNRVGRRWKSSKALRRRRKKRVGYLVCLRHPRWKHGATPNLWHILVKILYISKLNKMKMRKMSGIKQEQCLLWAQRVWSWRRWVCYHVMCDAMWLCDLYMDMWNKCCR